MNQPSEKIIAIGHEHASIFSRYKEAIQEVLDDQEVKIDQVTSREEMLALNRDQVRLILVRSGLKGEGGFEAFFKTLSEQFSESPIVVISSLHHGVVLEKIENLGPNIKAVDFESMNKLPKIVQELLDSNE